MLVIAQAANYPRVKESCTGDDQCFTDFEYCDADGQDSSTVDLTGVCEHKDVWEMLSMEWLGSVLTFLILLVSNCGGLGGGGALIPIAIVFFGFDTKQAIA